MYRRTFLELCAKSALPILFGTIPTDQVSSPFQLSAEEIGQNRTKLKIVTFEIVAEQIKQIGLQIDPNYSLNRDTERIIMHLPDKHSDEFNQLQLRTIDQLLSVIPIDAMGIESVYETIDDSLINKVHQVQKKYLANVSLLQEKGTELFSFLDLLYKRTAQQKYAQEKFNLQYITEWIANISLTQEDENYLRGAGYKLILNIYKYHSKVHLFGLEEYDSFKEELSRRYELCTIYDEFAHYQNVLQNLSVKKEIKTQETKEETEFLELYTEYLNYLSNKIVEVIPNYPNITRQEMRDTYRFWLQGSINNIPNRNASWVNNVTRLDEKYRLIIVIGGSAHTQNFFDQQTKYSQITINNGLVR